MRLSILTFVVVCGLLQAPDARAQYASRSFGVGASISNSVEFAVTLEGSVYIDSGFDVYLRIPLTITNTATGAATRSGSGQVYGTGGSLGVRYLFLEERIRPYVGLQVSTLVLFTQPLVNYFVGPGATVGSDFFINDFLSLGVRASYDMFVDLNRPLRHSVTGGINVTTIF